ncbi:MAG: transcription repressor NadR [Clostridiales bacterium]|jgi:transcriptional regulator of NAD metabolism|nr:transcription repressor NadR [Clostridiales bacterium]
MTSNERRDAIINILRDTEQSVSATTLANNFDVSRQIVVGDIALLRASGEDIIATPRGYVLQSPSKLLNSKIYKTIACKHHQNDSLADELFIIVDNGGTVIDVIVDHPVYGQISGQLQISTRHDVEEFLKKFKKSNVVPLSELTDGIHLHTIGCVNEDQYYRIIEKLSEKGILLDK